MIIHEVAQGTPEWHALRAGHDTASEASAMMGASKQTTRSELLRMKSTGSVKEFSDWVQKHLLDNGHVVEANARPLVEHDLGEELYPCTATSDEPGLERLLASFDGVTMLEDTIWECKSWNEAKAEGVRNGCVPAEDYWQVVQQLVVSRAEKCVYTVTDGTPERRVSVEVTLDADDEKLLLAAWKQFNEDRANYKHVEEAAPLVAEPVEALPAVFVKVTGSVAVQNNFSTFEKALRFFLEEKLITDPATDQDFVDLDLQIKALKKAEDALQAAEEHALAQVAEVDSMKRAKDLLYDLTRKNRIASEKLLNSQKEKIKLEIRQQGEQDYAAHIAQINSTLGGGVSLPAVAANFVGAMKNKRTLSSLRDAVDTELARLKIETNGIADNIRLNLESLRTIATGYESLFRDRHELVLKDNETVELIARQRINEHKEAEEKRLEAERERIRKEEADRLEAEQKEREREAEEKRIADEAGQRAAERGGQAGGAHTSTDLQQPAVAVLERPSVVEQAAIAEPSHESRHIADAPAQGTTVSVVNKLELLKAVINGEVPDHVIAIDHAALLSLCDELQRPVPGTTWGKA